MSNGFRKVLVIDQRQGIAGKTNFEPGDCPANGLNQLTTCGFIYDAAGNLTFDGNNTYTYDAENRLIQVNGIAGTWSYVYDGEGVRVEKCAGISCSTTGTIYWRSALDGATLSESDLNVNFTSSYVLVNGKPIGRLDNPSDSAVYYLDDHLGSTSVILDSSANIVSESDYYPYGGEIPIITGDTNRYKFTGKERDGETGLDNFGARYYGSNFGRFMTPDPPRLSAFFDDPQTWNHYSYAHNNPLEYVDSNGKWPTSIHNRIINTAFPNLTASQRQILKDVSAHQDSILSGGQGNSLAFQHAMRGPGESVSQAEANYNTFVSMNEDQATKDQIAF